MAARPLISTLLTVRPSLTSRPVRTITSLSLQRPISTSKHLYTPSSLSDPPQTNPIAPSTSQSTSPLDDTTNHASFLGEADSNNAHDAYRDSHGTPHEAVDSTNAAFLGEADSDDGFESSKDINGVRVESVDASQASYLGEADSDDAFESDVEINPEKYRHRIEDVSRSGDHGQPGEGDQ